LSGGAASSDGGPATSDGASDADASKPSPDASDASAEATAEAGGWCATNAAGAEFCEDFDSVAGLGRFEHQQVFGGTLSLDGKATRSAPNALLAVADPTADPDAGASSTLFVLHAPGKTATRATLAFDVRFERFSQTSTTRLDFGVVYFGLSGGRVYEVGLEVTSDRRPYVYQYDPRSDSTTTSAKTSPLAVGQWARMQLTVRYADAQADLDIDGVRVVSGLALQPPGPSGVISFATGVEWAMSPHDGWSVRLDDETCDLQ